MKRSLFFFISFLLLTISLSEWEDGASSFKSLIAKSKRHNVPVIVYVRADWCPWCVKMDAALEDSKIDRLFRSKLAVKITPDNSPGEKKISKMLGVKGFPSLFVILPNGTKTKLRLTGLGKDNNKLYKTLKKQLDKFYK